MQISRTQLLALAALTLMWGVNWPMMKLSLREITPVYFRAITMTGGALWLYAYFRWRGVRMMPTRAELRATAWLALPNMFGWHLLSILGVRELASGRAAILGFTMPVWTVLLGIAFFGERLSARVAVAALSAIGAIALLSAHELSSLAGRPLGIVWMEGAAICWALGTLMMRRARLTLPIEAVTVWMMVLSAGLMWITAVASEPPPQLHFSGLMLASLAYGVFINYGFAQIIWFGLARDLPPATSAISIMAVPVIGTLSATFIVGEWPHWQDWASILFVAVAVAAVLLPRPQAAATPPLPER